MPVAERHNLGSHNKSRDDALQPGREDFEAIITANDVNFLAVHN